MPVIDLTEMDGKSEEEIAMMKMMGFSGFNSTKGKVWSGEGIVLIFFFDNNHFQPVAGNATGDAAGAVHKVVKRKYRQYMNRKGGFNRPLDAMQ